MSEILTNLWALFEPYLPTLIGIGGIIGTFFAALKRFKLSIDEFKESKELRDLSDEVKKLKESNSKLCKDNDGLRKDIAALITTLSKIEYKPTNSKEE